MIEFELVKADDKLTDEEKERLIERLIASSRGAFNPDNPEEEDPSIFDDTLMEPYRGQGKTGSKTNPIIDPRPQQDDESDLTKDMGKFTDWIKRKLGRKKEDIPTAPDDPYANLREANRLRAEAAKLDTRSWDERWKPGYPLPQPAWYKGGFSSYAEWRKAGSPKPKPKYTPKGYNPHNKLSDEERERRKKEREDKYYASLPNLRMSEIEERPDSKTELARQARERLRNENAGTTPISRRGGSLLYDSKARKARRDPNDPYYRDERGNIIGKKRGGFEQRLKAAQEANQRNLVTPLQPESEKKLTRGELLQQLVAEEKREWQAMKDVAREESAKYTGYIPPRKIKAGDAIARERDYGGGSFHEQAMADRGEPSVGDVLDQNIGIAQYTSDEPIDWEAHDLPWMAPPGTPAERKPSQQRLARIMEPEQRPLADAKRLNKALNIFKTWLYNKGD